MIEFTEEKIKEAYKKVSPVIKEILLDTWITEDTALIGRTLGIRIDKIDTIIRIIGYILLNLIPLSRLISVIDKETGIGKEKSTELAQKIDEIIFTKVRQKVREYKKPEDNISESVSESTSEPKIENTEDLRKSLLKDIENHANEFSGEKVTQVNSEPEKKETFADILAKSKTVETVEKVVDPYRTPID